MKKSFIYFALIILVSGCKNEQEPIPDSNPTCNFEPLILYTTTDDFCNTNSGSVDIGADIEIAEYSIDDGVTFQTSSIFTDLAGGVHRITMKDANDCLSVDSILILSKSGTLAFTTDTVDAGCGTSNGSITINATGGSGTLTYSIDGGTASSNNVFSSLSQGTY